MNTANSEINTRVRDAFLKLMNQKTYKRITFQELADESGMSRQNLYYYHKTKQDVLEYIVEDFFERQYDAMMDADLFESIEDSGGALGKKFMTSIVEELQRDVDVARCLFSSDVNIVFVNKMVAFLKRLLGSQIRMLDITINDPKYVHYLSLQLTGSTYLLLREWFLFDRGFSAERIVELGLPMVEQVIESLKNN